MKISFKKIKVSKFNTLFSTTIVIILGFITKYYNFTEYQWINNHLAGTFYVIFWSLVAYFIFSKGKPIVITAIVLIITISIEILQLYHFKCLEILRRTFMGKVILGVKFSWIDIVFYLIGFVLSLLWIIILNKHKDSHVFIKKEKQPNARNT